MGGQRKKTSTNDRFLFDETSINIRNDTKCRKKKMKKCEKSKQTKKKIRPKKM